MANTFTHYHVKTKSGYRSQEKLPASGRLYVAEVVTRVSEYETVHVLIASGKTVTLKAFCGFDRGPKLSGAIQRLLDGSEEASRGA